MRTPEHDAQQRWNEGPVWIVASDVRGWCVQHRDTGDIRYHRTRADAVREACALARRHEPSQLVIFRPDGQVEDHCRFGAP